MKEIMQGVSDWISRKNQQAEQRQQCAICQKPGICCENVIVPVLKKNTGIVSSDDLDFVGCVGCCIVVKTPEILTDEQIIDLQHKLERRMERVYRIPIKQIRQERRVFVTPEKIRVFVG